MNEFEIRDTVSLGCPLEDERDEILSLCALASEPYDRFVWRTAERAREVAEFLWARDAGEVTADSCTVWRDSSGVIGVLTQLSGLELRRARLRAAVLLSRSEEIKLQTTEREYAGLAAAALANVSPEDVYLARIAIDGRARGAGLARIMLAHLSDTAAQNGARFLVLEVEAGNTRARSVYESAGFQVSGDQSIEKHAGVTLHLVEMRRRLDVMQAETSEHR